MEIIKDENIGSFTKCLEILFGDVKINYDDVFISIVYYSMGSVEAIETVINYFVKQYNTRYIKTMHKIEEYKVGVTDIYYEYLIWR